jgi:hypothetical protein
MRLAALSSLLDLRVQANLERVVMRVLRVLRKSKRIEAAEGNLEVVWTARISGNEARQNGRRGQIGFAIVVLVPILISAYGQNIGTCWTQGGYDGPFP